jgi:GT2 family glycosyltransferase
MPRDRRRSFPAPVSAGFSPVRLLEVELGRPLPALAPRDPATGRRYHRALALVRLHTRPLGVVELALPDAGLGAAALARRIWAALGEEIAAHRRADRLPPLAALGAGGLPDRDTPDCRREDERLLAHAPFVSVIVPTRDRPEHLVACLRSLAALAYPRYEVIVVDNAPRRPTTRDLVEQVRGGAPRVRYLREDRPGKSWAHNRGLREARGEIVAFTDDDVVVDPHWLTGLVRGFAATEGVACVTGLTLPRELETPAQVWFEQFGGFDKGFARRVFDLAEHRPPDPLYPYTIGSFGAGNNVAFRTAALAAIGGFDPALGPGTPARAGEDLALYFQLLARGDRLVYEPTALVRHLHRRDYAGLRSQVYGYGTGLSACLTKCLTEQPRLLPDFAARVPRGLVHLLSPRSAKNRKKRADFPRELTALERRGMLYGPVAYLRGRAAGRPRRGQPITTWS